MIRRYEDSRFPGHADFAQHDRTAEAADQIHLEKKQLKALATAVSAAVLAVLIVTPAGADPIADREANMKERQQQLRVLGPIAQGKAPFDAAQVQAGLARLHELAQATVDVAALWPEGAVAEKSSPKIWEDLAGFTAANEKFAADTAAAVAAAPADLAAFQAAFGAVANNCGSCHEAYRL